MTDATTSMTEKRAGIDAPWSKIKFDRQIVAIARVHRASQIYTDDAQLIAFAGLCDIPCVRVADLPIPASALQPDLFDGQAKCTEGADDATTEEDPAST
jgi:hypothetical protein